MEINLVLKKMNVDQKCIQISKPKIVKIVYKIVNLAKLKINVICVK